MPGIDEAFCNHFPRSRQLAEKASHVIPRRVTHDARHMLPFPIYISHAVGPRKWDVDGNEYVDYAGGHGSLLLGHAHPKLLAAASEQLAKGTHLGASHELEIRWAQLITALVPCAQKVEFTMSGTEAVMLALRIARAYTGRRLIVKLAHHFHGWYDGVYCALGPEGHAAASLGLPPAALQDTVVLAQNDARALQAQLERREVAAVILEPSGARAGRFPADRAYLQALREVTAATGTLLIFDEVITGFRYSPGGAQEYYGITPDLCTLGKIVGGGLPAGAVAGKAEVMAVMEFGSANPYAKGRVSHTGTYNANPVTAAAGIAMLSEVATGWPTRQAAAAAAELRQALNRVLDSEGISGCVYGESSVCHLHLAPPAHCPPVLPNGNIPADFPIASLLEGDKVLPALRKALLLEGVDILSEHLWVSAVHGEEEISWTAEAFTRALAWLREEGLVSRR